MNLIYAFESFKSLQVPQRHKQGHFAMAQRYAPLDDIGKILVIWRIADDIVLALLKVHFKKVPNLAVTTVNDVIALNLVTVPFQNIRYGTDTAERLQYGVRECLNPQDVADTARMCGVEIVELAQSFFW